MSAKNVEMLRAAHESWNRRDFQGIVVMLRRALSIPIMPGVLT